MACRINLYFETFGEPEFDTEIIRLKTYVKFKTLNGWTEPFEAIVDTGAHTSILPLSLWKKIVHRSIKRVRIQGINTREECSVPAVKARINCILLDEKGNATKELGIVSYLALREDIPLIIGFKDVLSTHKVYFDYRKKSAYLVESKIKA